MKFKMFVIYTAAFLAAAGLLLSCGSEPQGTGMVSMNITDAPVDDPDIVGVHITVQSIEYNWNDEWYVFEDFIGNTITSGIVSGLNVTVPYKIKTAVGTQGG